jgi:hypothetical protein
MPGHGAIRIKVALAAGLLWSGLPAAAQAGGSQSTSCVGGRTSFNCVTRWQNGWSNPHIVSVPQARDVQERDRRWQARCRPVVRQDDFGVPRYGYAARGCEYGKID